jgi:hypothetical protein
MTRGKRLKNIRVDPPAENVENISVEERVKRGILEAMAVDGSTNFPYSIMYTGCDDKEVYDRVIRNLLRENRIEVNQVREGHYQQKLDSLS